TWFGVWLKNDVGNPPEPRRKKHGTSSVTTDSKCCDRFMFADDAEGVGHAGKQHGEILGERQAAFALKASSTQSFEGQSGLRHESHFDSALCSYQHNFPFRPARNPFAGNGDCGKNVAACASACDEELHRLAWANASTVGERSRPSRDRYIVPLSKHSAARDCFGN